MKHLKEIDKTYFANKKQTTVYKHIVPKMNSEFIKTSVTRKAASVFHTPLKKKTEYDSI